MISILLLSLVLMGNADVIFTSERCNRATFGLRTVNGDPSRYKQCGPSGRVWIVPCAPMMMFDAQDRVCKEPQSHEPSGDTVTMRKHGTNENIITTPAPNSPIKAAEEFVFSTIRPKRPKTKGRTRVNKLSRTTTTLAPNTNASTPKIVIFAKNSKGGAAFTRPGRVRSTTPIPVTHATKFLAPVFQKTSSTPVMVDPVGMPHTLAPYKKAERNLNEFGEPLTTIAPEYTVRYNGKSMTENEFLNQLLHIVQHQKAVSERVQQEKFERMEKERLRMEQEEREREAQRRRRLEEAERARILEAQKQAELFAEQERNTMERELEMERIRQAEKRKVKNERVRMEMEASRQREIEEKMHQKRVEEKMREIERQREMERIRVMEEEENKRMRMEQEKAEREKEVMEELRRREIEKQRRIEKQMRELREMEEQRRRAAEERAQFENMEKEREIIREMVENQRMAIRQNANGIIETTTVPEMKPIYENTSDGEMIRFTTAPPEWQNSIHEKEGPVVYEGGCSVNGDCELKYDYDSFCRHPSDSSLYLQCAPLYGRHGKWTERQCPDTLVFMVSIGRCEKSTEEKRPYDPDNRVVIPRLPSETSFIQWSGNRLIDTHPPVTVAPRVYPPVPEPHQPQIYNTIEEFPKELLPKIPDPDNTYAQLYQNHIRESVAGPATHNISPGIRDSYDSGSKSEIDLSHIHPLFPRVQPDFLSKLFPSWKLQDENPAPSNTSIGGLVKPVLKQIALNQTEQFLERLLADHISDKEKRKGMIDRFRASNTIV